MCALLIQRGKTFSQNVDKFFGFNTNSLILSSMYDYRVHRRTEKTKRSPKYVLTTCYNHTKAIDKVEHRITSLFVWLAHTVIRWTVAAID